LLEDSASKFYKYIVKEKVNHIDNVVFDVHVLPDLARKEFVTRSLSRDLVSEWVKGALRPSNVKRLYTDE